MLTSFSRTPLVSNYSEYFSNPLDTKRMDDTSAMFAKLVYSWLDPSKSPEDILKLWFDFSDLPLALMLFAEADPLTVPSPRKAARHVLHLIHHPLRTNAGPVDFGTVSNDSFGCLNGGIRGKSPMDLNLSPFSFVNENGFVVPSGDVLTACTSSSEFSHVMANDELPPVRFRASFPLPPILASIYLDPELSCWTTFLPKLLEAIRSIDSLIPNRPGTSEACNKLVQFLWLMVNKDIVSANSSPFPMRKSFRKSSNSDLKNLADGLERSIFGSLEADPPALPPSSSPKSSSMSSSSPAVDSSSPTDSSVFVEPTIALPSSPNDLVSAFLACSSKLGDGLLSINHQLAADRLERSKGKDDSSSSPSSWFSHVTPKQARMLLLLSSHKGSKIVPKEPNKEMKIFLESKQGNTPQLLEQALCTDRGSTAKVPIAKAFLIWKLNFASQNRNDELRLSLFHCFSRVRNDSDGSNLAYELAVAHNHLSDDMIKKASSIPIGVAGNEHELLEQVLNGIHEFDFIFGSKSRLTLALKSFYQWCSSISGKHHLKQAFLDKDTGGVLFGSKIVDAIDNRLNRVLLSAMRSNDLDQLDWSPLNFVSIQETFENDGMVSRSVCKIIDVSIVQPFLSSLADDYSSNSDSSFTHRGGKKHKNDKGPTNRNKKRHKNDKSNKDLKEKVPAENPRGVPEKWKLTNKEWSKVAREVHSCPKLNDVSICARFWFLGSCASGKDCPRHPTHKNLPTDVYNELDKWILETKKKLKLTSSSS